MSIESPRDLRKLADIGKIVAECLQHTISHTKPGMTTKEVDAVAAKFLRRHKARSAPKLAYNFPGHTCISVNHQIAHGVPSDLVLKEGDLVNIDVSAERAGYWADTGFSFQLAPHTEEIQKLLAATREALALAMTAARSGGMINHIGLQIENVANRHGFTIIRNLGSHGVGRHIHEEPEFIAGYYEPRDLRVLEKNTVITIEPFLSNGATWADENADGWTLETKPQFRAAQFEHTMVITDGEPILLTA